MKKKLRSSKGQVILEAVLLMVIMLGLWKFLSNQFIESNYMKKMMQDGPWPRLSGMIESGVWEKASSARAQHPNNLARAASKKEE